MPTVWDAALLVSSGFSNNNFFFFSSQTDAAQRPTAQELQDYLLTLESNEKVVLPALKSDGKSTRESVQDNGVIHMKYLDDIGGEPGNRAREKAEDIQDVAAEM